MRCRRIDHLLPAYVEDSLAPPLAERVEAHLAACSRCSEEESSQRQAMRLLDRGRHVPSIDLWADFSRRLQQQPPPRQPLWKTLWQPGMASALAALVVGLVARSAPLPPPNMAIVPVPGDVRTAVLPSEINSEPEGTSREARRGAALQRESQTREERRPAILLAGSVERAAPVRIARGPEFRRPVRLARTHVPVHPRRLAITTAEDRESREHSKHMLQLASLPAQGGSETTTPRSWSPESATVPAAADPLDVAEALVEPVQDATSDRIRGELLLMAGAVARAGGEASASDDTALTAGT